MANVATASKEQVDWAIGILDKAGEGEEINDNDFFRANALLTVVAYAAFDLAKEVERLRLAFAFHCQTGALSIAQVVTALNMSRDEVMELMKKLPQRREQ